MRAYTRTPIVLVLALIILSGCISPIPWRNKIVFTAYIVYTDANGRRVNQRDAPHFDTREACEEWLAKQPLWENEDFRFCSKQIFSW